MANRLSGPPTVKRSVARGHHGKRLNVGVVRYRLQMSKQELPSFPEFLADAIKRARFETPTDFARAAGVHPSVVSRWLKGERPSARLLERVAPTLRVSVKQLLAIAYPGADEPEAPESHALHPLALDVERLLSEESPVPPDERATLATLLEHVVSPYRRHLRRRKAG